MRTPPHLMGGVVESLHVILLQFDFRGSNDGPSLR